MNTTISAPAKPVQQILNSKAKVEIVKTFLLLRAIRHRLREQLLLFIDQNPGVTVTEIYSHFRIEQSVASQHLAILRRVGIISPEREGKNIRYRINKSTLEQVIAYCEQINGLCL